MNVLYLAGGAVAFVLYSMSKKKAEPDFKGPTAQNDYFEDKAKKTGQPVQGPTNGGATYAPPPRSDTVYDSQGMVIGYKSFEGTGGPLLGGGLLR